MISMKYLNKHKMIKSRIVESFTIKSTGANII